MGSFTIHTLDKALDLRLTNEARRNKKSKNQLIKEILAKSLGLPVEGRLTDDYREFCGLWDLTEQEKFNELQKDNSQVDSGDWNT
ncbi:MAG: hypothetical protein KAQ69_11865 [Spirochaetales bacterium]|nr:hypothetical protein [Spirochaetales bacterium]